MRTPKEGSSAHIAALPQEPTAASPVAAAWPSEASGGFWNLFAVGLSYMILLVCVSAFLYVHV